MLNEQKGNMYGFVSHTWNTVKGKCFHDCEYCYMKRWGTLKEARFDKNELKTDLGKGNFIFVGSSCDMFAANIPYEWIEKTIDHCKKYENDYLFQTKRPESFHHFSFPKNTIFCTTIETNRVYSEMGNTSSPMNRAFEMGKLSSLKGFPVMITIEPIMDFDLSGFKEILKIANPAQINIGADSGKNNLTEPSKDKINELIEWIKSNGIEIVKKNNLERILK